MSDNIFADRHLSHIQIESIEPGVDESGQREVVCEVNIVLSAADGNYWGVGVPVKVRFAVDPETTISDIEQRAIVKARALLVKIAQYSEQEFIDCHRVSIEREKEMAKRLP